jgi:hypothetical protein
MFGRARDDQVFELQAGGGEHGRGVDAETVEALDTKSGDWCTSSMADDKKRGKDIVLWIITVALVALAAFWYKR